MASYPLQVAPPPLRVVDGGSVVDDVLRQSPQDFFQASTWLYLQTTEQDPR